MDLEKNRRWVKRPFRRDEQALWVCGWYQAMEASIDDNLGWYTGEKGADIPAEFLSARMRAGSDGQRCLRHRMLSLGRAMCQQDPLDSEAFREFREIVYEVPRQLRRMAEFSEVQEGEQSLDAFFDYVERMSGRPSADERYGERVQGMLGDYLGIWDRLVASVQKYERQLLGCAPSDPDQWRTAETVETVKTGVERLLRRAKVPTTNRQREWVMRTVREYFLHPEACYGDVGRRRVALRDVWETVKTMANDRYGIRDFEHFRVIYESGSRYQRRHRHPAEAGHWGE